jgi:hypothetical protein
MDLPDRIQSSVEQLLQLVVVELEVQSVEITLIE